MNAHYKPTYYFIIKPHPEFGNCQLMTLLGGDPDHFKSGVVERMPAEIARLATWPQLHFCSHSNDILGWSETDSATELEQSFYLQRDNLLLGEDHRTNRAILAHMYGPTDDNGVLVPTVLSLSISNIRFDTINKFNCPSSEHDKLWEEALHSKWHKHNSVVA